MVCATSAFRDADNKQEIVHHVQEVLNITIHIVEGEEEALLLHKAIHHLLEEPNNYLHVEVGGGVTEVNLYTGPSKIASRSFDLGSVRIWEHDDAATSWEAMQTCVSTQKQYFTDIPIGDCYRWEHPQASAVGKKRGKKTTFSRRLRASYQRLHWRS